MSTKQTDTEAVMDHRTRVGMERRRKMRIRLIESAFIVFAEKGVDVSVIDDVIAVAKVSRGTFYNYFRTNSELMAAVGETLSNELIDLIESIVGEWEDPVEILTTGLRLFLRTARNFPQFANFLWRSGFNANSSGNLIYSYLPRHITRSMQQGRIQATDPISALEFIVGSMLAAIFGISNRSPQSDYPEQMVRHALLGLGVSKEEASRLVALTLPDIQLPEDSILVKTSKREAVAN